MDSQDDEYTIDRDTLCRQVAAGNFALRPHAMQHAVKEGFTQAAVLQVILQGRVIEAYPGRNRCLFYTEVMIEGVRMPLHAVCEHLHPEEPVDVVTAYIPSGQEWETPTRRRKK